MNPYLKQYLMTAGPTPVPPAVSQAMAAPMLYHRAPAFDELYERVLGKLPSVFRTSNDVLAFAASGTGALESAVANLVRPGDKILVGAAGKFGERALGSAASRPAGRYYCDWGRTAKSQRSFASPFTPAVSLFLGLDTALNLIEEEGLDNVLARHQLLARATRAGVAAMGLDVFGDPDERSTVVTAVELPEDIDGGKVPGGLRKLGITANGGQDHLKGRILRIAHCGYFGAFDILTSLSGLEIALANLGHEVEHGAGVGAAQKVFLEAGALVAPTS